MTTKKFLWWAVSTYAAISIALSILSYKVKLFTLTPEAAFKLSVFNTLYLGLYFSVLFILFTYNGIRHKNTLYAFFAFPVFILGSIGLITSYRYYQNRHLKFEIIKYQVETQRKIESAKKSGTQAEIIEITSADQFNTLIENSTLPVVIKCSADWCGPCKKMQPTYKVAAMNFADQIVFTEVNVDHVPAISEQLNIKGLPSFVCFKDGKESFRIVGAKNKKEFLQELQKLVS